MNFINLHYTDITMYLYWVHFFLLVFSYKIYILQYNTIYILQNCVW